MRPNAETLWRSSVSHLYMDAAIGRPSRERSSLPLDDTCVPCRSMRCCGTVSRLVLGLLEGSSQMPLETHPQWRSAATHEQPRQPHALHGLLLPQACWELFYRCSAAFLIRFATIDNRFPCGSSYPSQSYSSCRQQLIKSLQPAKTDHSVLKSGPQQVDSSRQFSTVLLYLLPLLPLDGDGVPEANSCGAGRLGMCNEPSTPWRML